MKFTELEDHFSRPRITRYLHICGNRTRAVKLYKANIKLSQAFHPLLGIIEVALRNNLNRALASYFGDPNWIINQKTGFMASPTLRGTRFYLKTEVEKTERKLRQRGVTISNGKVVAEQTFGFWTDLFEPHHFRLIGASPMRAFSNPPRPFDRSIAAGTLRKIRKFRNRINHYEPIILNGHNIDLVPAADIHNSIINVLGWLDPRLVGWVGDLDKVPQTLARCSKI